MTDERQLTAAEFESHMNTVIAGLRLAHQVTQVLSDEDLAALDRTIRNADNMAFLLVPPLQFGKANDNLDHQRGALAVLRKLRAYVASLPAPPGEPLVE